MSQFEVFGMPLYTAALTSRAITAENKSGAVGAGGKAFNGRKGEPCLPNLARGMTYTFAEIEGAGAIRHIWMTVANRTPETLRNLILRFYWDKQTQPSVEAPMCDFFGISHGKMNHFESAFITMAEGKSFTSYFLMPFGAHARLTITNEGEEDAGMFFYQVDYTLGDAVDAEAPRFHAQFRRVPRTTMYEDYVILDGVRGRGRFLGANIGIVDRYHACDAWWGEGEVKIYLDGDAAYPTICGTGAEDYAGSAWGLGQFHAREFGAPYIDGKYISFYRFHGHDPVYFSESIQVTLQQIGNDGSVDPLRVGDRPAMDPFIQAGEYVKNAPGGNFERVDDVCSTAYWYQTLPTQPFPAFPQKDIRTLDLPGMGIRTRSAADGPPASPEQ